MRRFFSMCDVSAVAQGLALGVAGFALLAGAASAAPLSLGAAGAGEIARPVIRVQAVPSMEQAYIRAAQKELRGHGYDAGPVDGTMGARTRAAVRAYQRDAGLPVTGEVSKELVDHLMFAEPKVNRFPAPAPGIVLDIQRDLAHRGYYLGPLDGVEGPQTRNAIHRFLADAGLTYEAEPSARLRDRIRAAPPEIKAK